MNKIQYLIDCVKREIPMGVLRLGFQQPTYLNSLNISLDAAIKDKIINNWILRDCDVVSGVEAVVELTGVPIDYVEMGQVIRVGYGPTAGREITSVLSVGYGYNAITGGMPGIVSALTEPFQMSDVRCQLIGQNVVFIEGYVGVKLTNLRCVLNNDRDFNNIQPRSLPVLKDLSLLATKAFLYNELILNLHNAVNVNGIDMSAILDIVSGYADSATMYNEMLTTKWKKVAVLNDRISLNRHIRMQVPS